MGSLVAFFSYTAYDRIAYPLPFAAGSQTPKLKGAHGQAVAKGESANGCVELCTVLPLVYRLPRVRWSLEAVSPLPLTSCDVSWFAGCAFAVFPLLLELN